MAKLTLAAMAAAAAFAAAQPVSFSIAADGAQTPLRFPMLESVGSGHLALATQTVYQQALQRINRDVPGGFGFVRGHGVLDDDLSTYLGGRANMFQVFQAYDGILAAGSKPLVELSFMPAALARDPTKTTFHYRGGTSDPSDWDAWGAFIAEFVQLLVQRYGAPEVRSWMFEVWNEPQGCGFYCPAGDQLAGYLHLYNVTASAVKSVDPFLRVGGPATAQLAWVGELLNYTAANGVPLDFLSTHLYPSDPGLEHSRSVFEDSIAAVGAQTAAAGVPLVITEFSAGWDNAVSDLPYAASFLAHQALAFNNVSHPGVANTEVLSFWTFSDVFEEQGFFSAPYTPDHAPYQKFGLQTIYGISKPSYRAMQLIGQMRGLNGVPVTVAADSGAQIAWYGASPVASVGASSGTVDVLSAIAPPPAGTQGSTTLYLLVTNFNMIGQNWQLNVTQQAVALTVTGIPAARVAGATATVALIDSTHAFAKPVWQAWGSPTYPNASEIAAEMAASQLVTVPLALAPVPGTSGAVSVAAVTLEPYATASVTVTY